MESGVEFPHFGEICMTIFYIDLKQRIDGRYGASDLKREILDRIGAGYIVHLDLSNLAKMPQLDFFEEGISEIITDGMPLEKLKSHLKFKCSESDLMKIVELLKQSEKDRLSKLRNKDVLGHLKDTIKGFGSNPVVSRGQ